MTGIWIRQRDNIWTVGERGTIALDRQPTWEDIAQGTRRDPITAAGAPPKTTCGPSAQGWACNGWDGKQVDAIRQQSHRQPARQHPRQQRQRRLERSATAASSRTGTAQMVAGHADCGLLDDPASTPQLPDKGLGQQHLRLCQHDLGQHSLVRTTSAGILDVGAAVPPTSGPAATARRYHNTGSGWTNVGTLSRRLA